MYKGHCLCNRVCFEFDSNPTDIGACHCSICRHITGTAFGAYVQVSATELKLTSGADDLTEYQISEKSRTQFCRICGSTVFSHLIDHPSFVFVNLGAISGENDLRLMYHEYVGSKASWYEIQDSLPQHEYSVDDA